MISASRIPFLLFAGLLLSFCTNKKTEAVSKDGNTKTVKLKVNEDKESIEGLYETQPDPDSAEECTISVEIAKTANGYTYILKTKLRQLKGIASLTTNESGEKIIVLEGIEWDEYEGDVSREEDNDSISDTESKEPEIPVGIGASYTKDTLNIQNYGNAMNSYTKISECGRKYIQLIKK